MKYALLSLPLLALALQSCATGARSENMRPETPSVVTRRHTGSVRVAVTGGKETSPLWKSEISSESFAQGLSDAIRTSALFADVGSNASDHLLEVVFLDVDQPFAGASMTVTLTARWSLVSTKTNQTIWKSDISKSYTAGAFSSLLGYERLRLANEGAARENIRAGLEEIARLQF